mgnify:CR=1 FL=1
MWQAEHVFAPQRAMALYDFYQAPVSECDERIEQAHPRTTRSRNSGENLFDLFMAPSAQALEPPQKPGAVHVSTEHPGHWLRYPGSSCRNSRTVLTRRLEIQACQGLMTAAPAASKAPVSRVATVKPLAAAMAAM